MSIDLDAYRDLFVEEAREHVATLEQGLQALEHAQRDDAGSADGENVDPSEMFRAAHSLKGMAATVGLDDVAALAHTLEDHLEALRAGSPIDAARLLDAVGVLSDAVEAIAARQDPVGLPEATAILQQVRIDRSSPSAAPLPGASDATAPPPLPRSVRVPAARVDRLLDRAVALQIEEQRLARLVAQALGTRPSFALSQAVTRIQRAARELHADTMELRALPVELATSGLARRAREVAARHEKEVHLEVTGSDARIDRALLEALRDPLQHLVTNAVIHGIETPEARRIAGKDPTGTVAVRVTREGSALTVEVRDDGAGIAVDAVRRQAVARGILLPAEAEALTPDALFSVLTQPGFTTMHAPSPDAGRGVGLDVVAAGVARVGGTLRISSTPGAGTAITLSLPPTLELIEVIDLEIAGETYALPTDGVRRLVGLPADVLDAGQVVLRDGDDAPQTVPAVSLAAILGIAVRATGYESEEGDAAPILRLSERLKSDSDDPAEATPYSADGAADAHPTGILLGAPEDGLVVVVDAVGGSRQAVVKVLEVPGGPPPPIAGATLREDGRVAPLLDPEAILHRVAQAPRAAAARP